MKVLIIDDDADICAALKAVLPTHGFDVEIAHTGREGVMMARINRYDVLIVDLNLPDMEGGVVIQEIKEGANPPPILMFTVVGDVGSKVRLLNSGADDYLVKPFAFEELLARMRALVRRPKTVVPEKLVVENLTLDISTQEVFRGEEILSLTHKEFALLECLMRRRGNVVSKGELIEHAWDSSADPFSDAFDTHLVNLRRKIGQPGLIHTVRGRGYKIR